MAVVSFTQDPGGPPGAGYFADEFGNKRYAYDPVTAQNISQQQQAPQQPDMRMAQMAPDTRFGTTTVEPAEGGARGGGPQNASDVTPSYAPQGSPQQQVAGQVGGAPGTAPGNELQATAGVLTNDLSKALLSRRQQGPTAAHWQPSTSQEKVTDLRRPLSDAEKASFAQSDAQSASATVDQALSDRQRMLGDASADMAALPRQYAQMDIAQKKRDETSSLVQQDRSSLDQFSQELQQNQKSFNPNRLFDEKLGTAGSIGAALFRAIGTYAQIKGHLAENPAGPVIDAAIQRDVMAQRQQIEDSKGNVDNALNRLRLHFGDLDLAQKALEIAQHNYADTQHQFYAAATGSNDVVTKARASLAAQQQAATKRDVEFNDRSYGVRSKQVDDKYVPATSGSGESVDQALERLNKFATVSKTLSEANAKPKVNGRIQTTIAAGQNAIDTLEDTLDGMKVPRTQDGGYQVPGYLGRKAAVASNAGAELFGTERGAQLSVNRELLAGDIGKLVKGGVADAKEGERMNALLDKGDPASLIQLHKLMRGFVRNYQNAGALAAPDGASGGGGEPIVEDQ